MHGACTPGLFLVVGLQVRQSLGLANQLLLECVHLVRHRVDLVLKLDPLVLDLLPGLQKLALLEVVAVGMSRQLLLLLVLPEADRGRTDLDNC